MTDVDPTGSELDQAVDLRLLIKRPEIEMQAVLHGLAVGHLHEQDVRRDVDLGAAFRRFDSPLVRALIGDAPSQSLRPEVSKAFAVGGVDDNALDPDVH